MTTPAEKKVIELAREVIANFSDNGEFMEFECPICGGDKEYNAMLVRDINTPEEDENREARVFCDCHDGQVEMLVEYEYLAGDTALRDLELAFVSLDTETVIEAAVKPELKNYGWDPIGGRPILGDVFVGEFGDAHHKSTHGDHGESPPFTPEQLSELAARGYVRTSQRPAEGILVTPEGDIVFGEGLKPFKGTTTQEQIDEVGVELREKWLGRPTGAPEATALAIAALVGRRQDDRPVRRRRRQK